MRRLLLIMFLLSGAALLSYVVWQHLKHPMSIQGMDMILQERIAASDTSLVYVLTRQHWTNFNIPKNTQLLRVVTNATLPFTVNIKPDMSWSYVLQYEFMDSSGKVLLQRDYSYRTGLKKYENKDTGVQFFTSFYLDSSVIPADGQVVTLSQNSFPETTRMRVKILQADLMIQDVAFRAYLEVMEPEFSIGHSWLRLSNEQKIKLAEGNVYAHDLLTENEKYNVLRHKKHPLGPTGIAGDAYQSRTLYIMRSYQGQQIVTPIRPSGLYVNKYTHGMIALPEEGGGVRLNFSSLEQNPAPNSIIRVRWFGRLLAERSQTEVIWHGDDSALKGTWKGGLLEVIANSDLAVRAFLAQTDEKEQEVTPVPIYLRAFVADQKHPINFAVSHLVDKPTPFRIDIRQALPDGQTAEPVHVRYQLIDQQGTTIHQGNIETSPIFSIYDRILPDSLSLRVTDPSSYYFLLPPDVSVIRLYADKPTLLVGYTRPLNLVRESHIPEDAYVANNGMDRQVSWFIVKPKNVHALVMNNDSMLLAIQFRPPLDNPDLVAGRYQWQDIHPQGAWLGRSLFTPVQNVGLQHDGTLSVTYRPMMIGKEISLSLRARKGVKTIQPKLAYFRTSEASFKVRVYLDGQLHYQGRVAGRDGEISLPTLQVGDHSIRIASTVVADFYLSNTEAVRGSLLKRLVNRFKAQPLEFVYHHGNSNEESLGLHLYTAEGNVGRSQIRVWLEAHRPLAVDPMTNWSFINRRFDVRPRIVKEGESSGSRVTGHRGLKTDAGQSFFLPIGHDVPPGAYRLHVALEQGPGGYLLLSRLVPGLVAERQVVFEQELQHAAMQK